MRRGRAREGKGRDRRRPIGGARAVPRRAPPSRRACPAGLEERTRGGGGGGREVSTWPTRPPSLLPAAVSRWSARAHPGGAAARRVAGAGRRARPGGRNRPDRAGPVSTCGAAGTGSGRRWGRCPWECGGWRGRGAAVRRQRARWGGSAVGAVGCGAHSGSARLESRGPQRAAEVGDARGRRCCQGAGHLHWEVPLSPKPKHLCGVTTASHSLRGQTGKWCSETTLTGKSASGRPVSSHICSGSGPHELGESGGCWCVWAGGCESRPLRFLPALGLTARSVCWCSAPTDPSYSLD